MSTFCNMISIKPDFQGDLIPTVEESAIIGKASVLVFDIINHVSKSTGYIFGYLKEHNDFIKLLIRCLYSREKDIIDSVQVITIL